MKLQSVVHRCTRLGLGIVLVAVPLSLAISFGPAHAAPTVSTTQHKHLGFNASFPFSDSRSDDKGSIAACLAIPPGLPYGYGYSVGVSGTASLHVDLGSDFTFSYDKANVVPGGSLPLDLTYTPTGGNIHVSAPMTFNLSTTVKICPVPPVHDNIAIPCTFEAGPTNFTAPLTGDAPINVPVSSCNVSLSIAGVLDVGSAHMEGTITLSPVPAGGLGMGGAVAAYGVTGPAAAPLIPLVEWDNAGETKTTNITLDGTLPGCSDIDVNLQPAIHWVATSADIRVVIELSGTLHDFGFSDPSPISVFSGSLGPVYTGVGLDQQVKNAILAAFASDPTTGNLIAGNVATAIAAGNVPIPLTDPELESIDPGGTPTLGTITFTVGTDVTAPTTVASLSPAPQACGWNNSSVAVSLDASDGSGCGVANITYSATGAQPIGSTVVPGSHAAVNVTQAGVTTISYYATDTQNNVESTKTVTVRIDETDPSIAIVEPMATDYTHSSTLTLDYTVTDAGGSGLVSVSPLFDGLAALAGHGLADGQAIDLLTEVALGSHTFSIDAADCATNTAHSEVTFNVIVTAASIQEDVDHFVTSGDIHKGANSLLAKLRAAAAAVDRGNCEAATGAWQAFINEVEAQRDKGIDGTAADILIADAQYLIEHCSELTPAALAALSQGTGTGSVGGLMNRTPVEESAQPLPANVPAQLASGKGPSVVAWPSPYHDGTLQIAFAAGGGQDAGEVRIYDIAGRLVQRLGSSPYIAGYRLATWDGRDARGVTVRRGVYFIRAGGPGNEKIARLAVIR